MRNELETTCKNADCGVHLGAGQGVVHTRSRLRPYPVYCDSCMHELDEIEREAQESERP